MKFLGIIPARFGSSRLEGKPLKDICGHSMIEWVYKRSQKSKLNEILVATDDKRIADEVLRFGGKVVMTKKEHKNGTSRIAEVCEKLKNVDVIINIQGDEPLIEKEMINSLIKVFEEDSKLQMATLKHKINSFEELKNPSNVKVVTDNKDYALYFSRSVIPHKKDKNLNNYYKHVGIYGYRKDFVIKYSKLAQTQLEISESLEQLRVLENGYKIKVLETKYKLVGVDTEIDLEKVREIIKRNKIKISEE